MGMGMRLDYSLHVRGEYGNCPYPCTHCEEGHARLFGCNLPQAHRWKFRLNIEFPKIIEKTLDGQVEVSTNLYF